MAKIFRFWANSILKNFSDLGYNGQMGILDNFESYLEKAESAWDEEFHFESKPMPVTDDMGKEKFWNDLGRP